MNAQEAWLEANTFYCEHLKARITPEQCRINQSHPLVCDGCPRLRKQARRSKRSDYIPMSVEQIEAALRKGGSYIGAAKILKCNHMTVYRRVHNSKHLIGVVRELGFRRGRR